MISLLFNHTNSALHEKHAGEKWGQFIAAVVLYSSQSGVRRMVNRLSSYKWSRYRGDAYDDPLKNGLILSCYCRNF